jgi:hypothetical protein
MRKRMRDYTKQIGENWPTIMQAWEAHGEKRPAIECDLANKKVRAYASGEYIDSLSERTRETTRREFARTMDEGGIMVFVLDTKNRVLQSYSFPGVGKAIKRRPNKPCMRVPAKGGQARQMDGG